MGNELFATVDDYISGLFVPPDPALDQALASSTAAGLPAINVAPNQGKFLHLLVRMCRARTVLEVGTLGAYSTIWMARALPADGHIITLEVEAKHADVARANLDRAGVAGMVDVRLGRAVDSLAQIEADGSGPFDFVFIDADKPSNPDYFQWALRLTKSGSVIVVDNVVRDGLVVEAESDDPMVVGTRRLNDMMANEPRVSVTEVQTVGIKGHDGFALALVL